MWGRNDLENRIKDTVPELRCGKVGASHLPGFKIEEGTAHSVIKINHILMSIFENQSQCKNP